MKALIKRRRWCELALNFFKFLVQVFKDGAGVKIVLLHLTDDLVKFKLAFAQRGLQGHWIRLH